MMIIYKATNKKTNMCYIGQTINGLDNRIIDHIYEAFKRLRKDKFHLAMRTDGVENFVFEIIGKARNFRQMYQMERNAIRRYNSIENGYNTQIRKDRVR